MSDSGGTDTIRIKLGAGARQQRLVQQLSYHSEKQKDSIEFPEETKLIYEGIYDAVIIAHKNGQIKHVNQRACDMFEFSFKEFLSFNMMQLIAGSNEETHKQILNTLDQEKRVFIEGYCQIAQDEFFPAEITVCNVQSNHKDLLSFFIRNISLRRETEEKLRKAQSDLLETAHYAGRAEIATSVLHNVGNLLNSINVSCSQIQDTFRKPHLANLAKLNEKISSMGDLNEALKNERVRLQIASLLPTLFSALNKEFREIQIESRRLQQKVDIIKDVVSVQQTYATSKSLEEKLEIAKLIDDAISIIFTTANSASVNLEKKMIDLPPVWLQKSKFMHVLLNLLKNAFEAVALSENTRPTIQIQLEKGRNYLYLLIKDNGVGIAKENLNNIFTHGFTNKKDGHGFGLHSCANLMGEMDGKIRVFSEGPGKGATFTICIPIERLYKDYDKLNSG
ncbi:MAG: PAS domain-containing sensor histidine kinase [Lentisphaeria bacterium]|nr:PAS domain-containing sensor histidine kinase [Lentisphaeria bacterium]